MASKRGSWLAPALAFVALGGLALAVGIGVYQTYRDLGAEISPFGWFIMAAGSFLTLALSALLMGLSFYSARRGFDDRPPRDLSEE
jgi:ABC-type multidrug transport system permease subunit